MDQQTIYGKSHLAKIFLCYTLRGDQHESILLFYCHIDNFYLDWIYSAFFGTNLTFLLGFRCIKKFFQGRKHYDDYEDNTYYEDIHNQSDYTYTNPPKHDAIDVEYTEHEDDGDEQ